MSAVVLLFCLLKAFATSAAIWSSRESILIRNDRAIAVGAYNYSIFLLGGKNNRRQITEYRIDAETFIDLGENAITNDTWGYSQFWVQNKEILYMIDPLGLVLSTFNLNDRQFAGNWQNIDVEVESHGCLAVSSDHLYVVGGSINNGFSGYLDTLQVMDLLTHQWIPNAPSMNEPRGHHSCIAYDGYLWVFGGKTNTFIENNERIHITDITSNEWSYIEQLSVAAAGTRATSWQQTIFVIGGYSALSEFFDIVHIVNTTTGEVRVSPEKLVYPVADAGVVLTNNVIYVFGGNNVYGYKDTWMQYNLATVNISSGTSSNLTSTQTTNSMPYTSSEAPTVQHKTSIGTTNISSFVIQYLSSMTSIMTEEHNNDMTTSSMLSTGSYQDTISIKNTETYQYSNNKASFDALLSILVVLCTICVVCVFGWICYRGMHNKHLAENDVNNMDNNACGEANNVLVKEWLTATVGLPHYYPLFIENGLDSLHFISKIEKKEDLKDIGITIIGHQIQILAEIKQLNKAQNKAYTNINENEPKEEDVKDNDDSDHNNDDLWEKHHAEGVVESTF